ncbi:MAG: hypothetical protein J1G06_06720, partial [Oscillospiraceae bacterium]|nr:hypothetical protein [Oscillospiraceae bacterium]
LLGSHTDVRGSAKGIETLIKMARQCVDSKILIVSPILIDEAVAEHPVFSPLYGGLRAVEMSKELAPEFKAVADKNGCEFMNAADFAKASKLDGVHMDSDNHGKLASAIADKIKEIFA